MKKVMVLLLVISLLLVSPILTAQNETIDDKAYDCLENQIKDRTCAKLSPTEKIFALMATGKCLGETKSDSRDLICWPSDDCNLKTTAQAILALEKVNDLTTSAEDWLLSQNDTPSDVDWFLQIESSVETDCTIKYSSGGIQDITVRADKKLSGTGGSCLSLVSGGWWYRISPNCYDTEFEISCDESFLTSLLFKEKTSSTYLVSEKTSVSSAEGTTTEKVDSLCLEQDGKCNYEGTLWGAVALKSVGYDVEAYMPYLITGASKYPKILPESLLYLLTNYDEFRNTLLEDQRNSQYWDESGNKFYDTALALFPFQYSGAQEKENSIDWLESVQGKDGCWDGGNVLSNSFLLASLWPRQVVAQETREDCVSSGFYCMSEASCEGQILSPYKCASGVYICCDTAQILDPCSEQGGDICLSDEQCIGGTTPSASGLGSGEICCVSGRCEAEVEQNECKAAGGTCRSFSCGDDEESSEHNCGFGDNCCLPKSDKGGISWFWIILLAILILLIILAIIFREKLKPYWNKITSKFKRKKGGVPVQQTGRRPPRFPPVRPAQVPRGQPRLRPLFPQQSRMPMRRPTQKSQKDVDNVLKKLKEM